MPRMPWEASRPARMLFWIASLSASGGLLVFLHWRDSSHGGDDWDWFDWLEAVVSSLAAGLVLVGLVCVACLVVADRRRRSS